MPAATPGTLEEYDIVLSINEASINQQFRLLYLTPIRKEEDPDPLPPIPGKSAAPGEIEYLISHKLTIKGSGGKSLSGCIECPRVDFSPIANKQRTVKLIFKLLTNEEGYKGDEENGIPAYDKKYDSKFIYYVAESEDDPPTIRKEKNVNGYTFSFEAGLGKANIQEIQQRLLHPNTYKSLIGAVQSESLTPSSIFCLFQAKEIANTFAMQDAAGNPVSDNDVLGEFMLLLKTKFAPQDLPDDGSARHGKGLPTPDNPFVLGYGISETPAKETPAALLAPKNFQFSVTTAGPKGFPTLNFLMLTRDIVDINNVQKNEAAGYFRDNFFETLKATYVHPKSKLPEYEGIMAISSSIFLHQYISGEVADKVWIALPDGWDARGKRVTVVKDSDPVSSTEGNKYKRTQSWKSSPDWIAWNDNTGDLKEKWWGTNEIEITWESDPKLDGGDIAMDAARNVLLWVKGTTSVSYERERLTHYVHTKTSSFTKVATSTISVPFTRCFVVSTGDSGGWTIKEDPNRKVTPAMSTDNEGKKRLVIAKKEGEPGIFPKRELFGDYKNNEESWLMQHIFYKISDIMGTEIFDSALNKQLGAMDTTSFDSLQGKVVMPAGDVISFNGISADPSGNLYSLIKYKTKAGGAQVK